MFFSQDCGSQPRANQMRAFKKHKCLSCIPREYDLIGLRWGLGTAVFKGFLQRSLQAARAENYSLACDPTCWFLNFVLFCFYICLQKTGHNYQEFQAQSKSQYTCSSTPLIRNMWPRNCTLYSGKKKVFRVLNWKGGKKFSLSLTHKIWELPVGWGFISGGNSRDLSSQEI